MPSDFSIKKASEFESNTPSSKNVKNTKKNQLNYSYDKVEGELEWRGEIESILESFQE